jgi:hypothetical protein
MEVCRKSDDFLPIVKMLLNHFEIEVNRQDKVIIIIRITNFIFIFFLLVWSNSIT